MSSGPTLVSILIPVYNEAAYVGEVVERVRAVTLPPGVRREIIIVDDGSTDGTRAVIEALQGADLRVIASQCNGGKGMAIRLGIAAAQGDVILLQDADLEYDPADHPRVLAPILEGRAAIVYGSRFLGEITGMSPANRVANLILRGATNLLYGSSLTDEATAYKAFRADVLRGFSFRARRFEWCPEVTAKCLRAGHRIVEVPVRYRARSVGQGKKIRWWDLVHALWTLARYRLPGLPRPSRVGRATDGLTR